MRLRARSTAKKVAKLRRKQRVVFEIPSEATAWGMGDTKHGLAERHIAEAQQQRRCVTNLNESWCRKTGSRLSDEYLRGFPEGDIRPRSLCANEYGVGHCRLDFTQLQRDAIAGHHTVFSTIFRCMETLVRQELPLVFIMGVLPGNRCLGPAHQLESRLGKTVSSLLAVQVHCSRGWSQANSLNFS